MNPRAYGDMQCMRISAKKVASEERKNNSGVVCRDWWTGRQRDMGGDLEAALRKGGQVRKGKARGTHG